MVRNVLFLGLQLKLIWKDISCEPPEALVNFETVTS